MEFKMYVITRIIAAIIPACLLSVAVLISGVHYDAAQAKSRAAVAAACQCSGAKAPSRVRATFLDV